MIHIYIYNYIYIMKGFHPSAWSFMWVVYGETLLKKLHGFLSDGAFFQMVLGELDGYFFTQFHSEVVS